MYLNVTEVTSSERGTRNVISNLNIVSTGTGEGKTIIIELLIRTFDEEVGLIAVVVLVVETLIDLSDCRFAENEEV